MCSATFKRSVQAFFIVVSDENEILGGLVRRVRYTPQLLEGLQRAHLHTKGYIYFIGIDPLVRPQTIMTVITLNLKKILYFESPINTFSCLILHVAISTEDFNLRQTGIGACPR
jgi:hypothetical protein